MNIRTVSIMAFVALLNLSLWGKEIVPVNKSPNKKPNFVVILSDDQGWGDLSIHGNTNLSTPNIDSLATDGAIFDFFYACQVCAPTRAEFLTGRYHPRTGVSGTSTGLERINSDEITIADTFKKAGYATGAFGKWHNGSQPPYHPNSRGFDEYYGFTSGHWGNYFNAYVEDNGKRVKGNGFIVDDFTDHAMQFMEENKDKPFFCYIPYNTPHSPMQVPDEFYDKFRDKEISMHNRDRGKQDILHLKAALAMCENIDMNVGRIFKKLNDLNIADNTVVIYFSDNGPNGFRWNGDMKGKKGSVDEGGVRVPFLIRYPAKIKPGTRVTKIAGCIDLLPTLTSLADIPLISKKPLDGKDISPLLFGNEKNWPDRNYFNYASAVIPKKVMGNSKTKDPKPHNLSIRNQRFRLGAGGRLFDMQNDIGQRKDVSKEFPKIAKSMIQAKEDFLKSVESLSISDERPYPLGYANFTTLPARDGIPHGNVVRSARAPNCSFFTDWSSKKDRITWDIDVKKTAIYEAVIWYTCAKKDVGSQFELSFGKSKLIGTVDKANDPPLIGESDDRIPSRGSESYVKEFKPMKIGKIKLEKGKGILSLKALEIMGDEVMEVRMITFER